VVSSDLPQTPPKLANLDRVNLAGMSLGTAMLANNLANLALRGPVTLLQDYDRTAPAYLAEKFAMARYHYFA